MRSRSSGFTLVELMVVVLIIGILVAVAVPVFNAAKANAEKNTCQANQRTWAGVVQMIKADDKEPSFTFLHGGRLANSEWASVAVPSYLKRVPVCPATVSGYQASYSIWHGDAQGPGTSGMLYCCQWSVSSGTTIWAPEHLLAGVSLGW